MYDFAVVGVGPAGARFARQVADAGYSVVGFERGSVGTPLACSGHVSTDIWDFLPESAPGSLRQNRIFGARFHAGGPDSDAHLFYTRDEISNVIDRVELDRTLARCASSAGAEICEHHTVTDIDERENHVRLTVAHDGEAKTVEAKMVAGCDGPVSRVRQQSDIAEPAELLHGVLAFEDSGDTSDYVDVHLTAPRFFAWRIPRGDAGVEYGLAAPPETSVSALFDELTGAYDVSTDDFCSGAIPIGPPSRITTRRVFLIGDAAGQTKPFTGGGINYSMTAADAAADSINPDDPVSLRDYEVAWREELSTEISLGHWIRRAYSLPEPVQRLGLSLLAGEIGVHMDKPTSLLSRSHLKAFLRS
jgi:electron-transferring-flavoprotein dehydrogenase